MEGNCQRESIRQKHFGNNLRIRHDNCLIRLPKTAIIATSREADVVIVAPLASITMQSERVNVRIAANGQPYRYEFTTDRSNVGAFESADDAPVTISIESRHATIQPYQKR